MFKLMVSGLSAVLSVGAVVGVGQQPAQDEPEAPRAAVVGEGAEAVQGYELVAENDESSEPLRSAYVVLRQLRSERLEDRPRELRERALGLYREGVQAHEKGDLARARDLGRASLNLARAIELARSARRGDDADPELPPPPQAKVRVVIGDRVLEPAEVEALPDLPPVIELEGRVDEPAGEARKEVRVRLVPKVEAKVRAGRDAEDAGRGVEVRQDRVIVVSPRPGGDVVMPRVLVRPLPGEATKHTFRVEVPKGAGPGPFVFGNVGVPQVTLAPAGLDAAARARFDLRRAYDRIRSVRERLKDDADAKVYLDSAKDLYNAARRDAEAGRNERASELARAAESLARVPALLKGLKDGGEAAEGESEGEGGAGDDQAGEGRARERRIIIRKKADGEAATLEVRPRIHVEKRARAEADRKGPVEVEVRVETRRDAAGEEEGREDEAPGVDEAAKGEDQAATDDAGPVVGVGVALTKRDDGYVVQQVLPGTPAAEDGRIQEGDALIGVEVDGEVVEFGGKELEEVVELVRGKPGTKVRIVVQPKDSDEREVYELTRRSLPAPRAAAGPRGEGGGPAFRFVVPVPPPAGPPLGVAPRIEVVPLPGSPAELPPPLDD